MPHIAIEITEQQEARIAGLIEKREDFQIGGGRIGRIFLKAIEFRFHHDFGAAEKLKQEIPAEW